MVETTAHSLPLIVDLAAITDDPIALVGGKSSNLGEMLRAGFPVPPGFCLTTAAYQRIASGLLDDLLAELDRAGDDLGRVGVLASRARAIIVAAPVPVEITDAIQASYLAMGDGVPVAVRSSATAEDLDFASFAGQQDTYLNIVGATAVQDAVRRCWASLWTDRAVNYRTTQGIDHRTVSLAVVVQTMVEAAVAGVMFTANPVTGRRGELVIDANPGLGEAVVSGAVNPDHFVVDRASSKITARTVGDRALIIRAVPGGGTAEDRGADPAQPSLTDTQVIDLARLGAEVEEHYGSPQDTEWAIDVHDQLWLTQARPITTLYPLVNKGKGDRAYLCVTLAQGLTRPITPMGLQAFRLVSARVARAAQIEVADPLAGAPAYADPGQRVFIEATAALRSKWGRRITGAVFGVMEARSAAVLKQLADDPRFAITQHSPLPILRRVLPIVIEAAVPLRAMEAVARPAAARRRVLGFGQYLTTMLEVPPTATSLERLDHIERIASSMILPMGPRILPAPAMGFAALAFVRRILGDQLQPGELQTVLRALPHNTTTEMDLALWALATAVRSDDQSAAVFAERSTEELVAAFQVGSLPARAQAGLQNFLTEYGFRAVAEIDLGMARWQEDPTHIIGVMRNYLQLTDPDLAPDRQFARGVAEAEAMVASLVSRAEHPIKKRLVAAALRRTRELAGLREQPKYFMIKTLAAARQQLLLVAKDLVESDSLDEVHDIFFVDLKEVRQALRVGADLRDRVAANRLAYDAELRRRHIPRIVLSDGTEPEALANPADATPGALMGSPASAGQITGLARVVLDPVGARIEPGEILVAPSTDPGWTPLFLTAGGLVMEMGGSNSHGAVVAREYGIPAVVGVPDATHAIVTGQLVTVDGAAGTVVPHPADPSGPQPAG